MAKTEPAMLKFEEVKPTLSTRWAPRDVKGGEVLTGTYQGSKALSGKSGEFILYEVKDEKGTLWGLSGRALDRLFVGLAPGAYVRVTHLGLRMLESGRPLRDYKLEVAR